MNMKTACILLAPLAAACATGPVKAPPIQAFALGIHRAEFRDYRKGDICAAEPRWLIDELRSPLALMGRFVDGASRDPDGEWADDALAFLEEGRSSLGPLVEVMRANLARARDCSFASRPEFVALLRDGPARCEHAGRLMGYVPSLLEYRRARQAREEWKRGRVTRESDARALCEYRGSSRRIYQWVVDCDGSQEWSFCDGARVTRAAAAGAPLFTPPIIVETRQTRHGRKRRRPPPPPREETYLSAAKAYEDADRCPKVPGAPVPPKPPARSPQ